MNKKSRIGLILISFIFLFQTQKGFSIDNDSLKVENHTDSINYKKSNLLNISRHYICANIGGEFGFDSKYLGESTIQGLYFNRTTTFSYKYQFLYNDFSKVDLRWVLNTSLISDFIYPSSGLEAGFQISAVSKFVFKFVVNMDVGYFHKFRNISLSDPYINGVGYKIGCGFDFGMDDKKISPISTIFTIRIYYETNWSFQGLSRDLIKPAVGAMIGF